MKGINTVIVILALALHAHTAAAVSCGDTITTDSVLTADLDCSGFDPAFTVDGATLDMQGHTLVSDVLGAGIVLTGTGAALLNGKVSFCKPAVRLEGTGGHLVSAVHAWNNSRGFVVVSGDNTIDLSVGGPNGIYSYEILSDGNVVKRSVVGSGSTAGMFLGGKGNKIANNLVAFNSTAPGIFVTGTENVIKGNTITANGVGVQLMSGPNKVVANVLDNNLFAGVLATANGLNLAKNVATENGSSGFQVTGDANKIIGNRATRNSTGFIVDGDQNKVTGNAAIHNSDDGIRVAAGSTLNKLSGNRALANGGNGIQFAGQGSKIQRNSAFGNTATDLTDADLNCGGNTWSDNINGTEGPSFCVD